MCMCIYDAHLICVKMSALQKLEAQIHATIDHQMVFNYINYL